MWPCVDHLFRQLQFRWLNWNILKGGQVKAVPNPIVYYGDWKSEIPLQTQLGTQIVFTTQPESNENSQNCREVEENQCETVIDTQCTETIGEKCDRNCEQVSEEKCELVQVKKVYYWS